MYYNLHNIGWAWPRYKFDDERVTKEDMKRAQEEQYGGEEEVLFSGYFHLFLSFLFLINVCILPYYDEQLPQTNPGFNNSPFKFTKYSNAYMLVYIRECDKDKIICNVDEKDIAEHLRVRCLLMLIDRRKVIVLFVTVLCPLNVTYQIRLKKEQEEKEHKRKEKAEAHLYTVIKVEIFKIFLFLSVCLSVSLPPFNQKKFWIIHLLKTTYWLKSFCIFRLHVPRIYINRLGSIYILI